MTAAFSHLMQKCRGALPSVGPGILVTAAFVGPGTVFTASMAGANFGYSLLWALLFSVLATLILQEMTARLGIVTGQGLGENIADSLRHPLLRGLGILLVTSAIVIGNGAYQGGNIAGATLGLNSVFEPTSSIVWPLVIGAVAFSILWTGSYALIEKALIVLVTLMSLAFIASFILTDPDWGSLFSGLLLPDIPQGSSLTIIALIGTTVVPYNLFLHASSVSKKWHSTDDLAQANKDIIFAVPLGGLISLAIVSTAASAFFGQQVTIHSAADLAPTLEPLFGASARYLIATGLFCAGISSAITAPLAAAYALTGIFRLNPAMNSMSFRLIWIVILLLGVLVTSLGYKPVNIIWFAQVSNGILLPVITLFLLWLMNQKKLGVHKNTLIKNLLGLLVLAVTLLLSAKSLSSAFGLI